MPDYLICLECESPCYVFEWEDEEVREATCEVCGNDDPERFLTASEFEEMEEGD